MTPPDTDDIPNEILRTLRKLIRQISMHSKYLAREAGLTLPQLMCLKAIGELEDDDGDVTVAQVSERVQLSAATVSRILDRLARADLVTRDRSTRDRRKVNLRLTAAGLERFQTMPTPLQETFLRRLSSLPESDRRELLGALRRVAELMEASDVDAAPILATGIDFKSSDPWDDSGDEPEI